MAKPDYNDETAKKIIESTSQFQKHDVRSKKYTKEDLETFQENAGMFIVYFDKSQRVDLDRPSCNYNVNPNEKDNVASLLRKNQKDIQDAVDSYFGIDESDKEQRIFISHDLKDNNMSYCTVTYNGYESDNDGEVAAFITDQLNDVIPKKVRMTMNQNPYPITRAQFMSERDAESARLEMDKGYISDDIQSQTGHGLDAPQTLDESACQETEAVKDTGMQM